VRRQAAKVPTETWRARRDDVAFGIGGTDSIDNNAYQVIRVYVQTQGVPPGKYLVEPRRTRFATSWIPASAGASANTGARAEAPRLAKATLMRVITDGILTHRLPWGLVLIGVFLTIAIELMGVSSLPVAVGVYLPITTSAGMFAGGIVRWLVERKVRSDNRSLAEIESGPGVLFASGLIAGGAICGIAVAAIAGWGSAPARQPTGSPKPCRCITTWAGLRRQPSLA